MLSCLGIVFKEIDETENPELPGKVLTQHIGLLKLNIDDNMSRSSGESIRDKDKILHFNEIATEINRPMKQRYVNAVCTKLASI